jgi:hypothetical protein
LIVSAFDDEGKRPRRAILWADDRRRSVDLFTDYDWGKKLRKNEYQTLA